MEQTKKPLPGAVLLLAALGFVLGTCEFVIVGILPEIAEGLQIERSKGHQIRTADV